MEIYIKMSTLKRKGDLKWVRVSPSTAFNAYLCLHKEFRVAPICISN